MLWEGERVRVVITPRDSKGLTKELVSCSLRRLDVGGNKRDRRLRVATWNFSGLGSERKQKEVGELLAIDVVAGHESWEKEDTGIYVEGYKWFGKPRSN